MPIPVKSGGRRLSIDARAKGEWVVLTIREDGLIQRIPLRAEDAGKVLDLIQNAYQIVAQKRTRATSDD